MTLTAIEKIANGEDFRIRFNSMNLIIMKSGESKEQLLEEYIYEPNLDDCFPEIRYMRTVGNIQLLTISFIKLNEMRLFGFNTSNHIKEYITWSYDKNNYFEAVQCHLSIKALLSIGLENNKYVSHLMFLEDIPKFRVDFLNPVEIAFF